MFVSVTTVTNLQVVDVGTDYISLTWNNGASELQEHSLDGGVTYEVIYWTGEREKNESLQSINQSHATLTHLQSETRYTLRVSDSVVEG